MTRNVKGVGSLLPLAVFYLVESLQWQKAPDTIQMCYFFTAKSFFSITSSTRASTFCVAASAVSLAL